MSSLLASFEELARSLPTDDPPPGLGDQLLDLQAQLDGMLTCYRSQPPLGAEVLYQRMTEALETYLGATGEMLAYLDDQDPARLSRAAQAAREAEDIFAEAEYEVNQSQSWLGDHQQG